MNKIKKALWLTAGFICLGIAYIGIITPGIPWSTPVAISAYCFARSSDRWHKWLLDHKLFGPFLRNWGEKRIYPSKAKWIMFICMDLSLIILWITTQNWKLVLGVALFMAFWMIWAIRYPGSLEEWQRRINAGERIGWFK